MAGDGATSLTRSLSDLHLFIVWSRGRDKESEILSDLARHFTLLEVREVTWTEAEFSRNLTRFYGEALPSGSEKERHCGNGPFLVLIVADDEPRLSLRYLKRGRAQVVDLRVLEAKERYRDWTGGGHRVHATLDPPEFAHDLFLLLRRLPSDYGDADEWNGEVVPFERNLVGAGGWRDLDELLVGLELTVGQIALTKPAASGNGRVSLAVDDPWWAAVVADGSPGVRDPWAKKHIVRVGERTVHLELEPSAPSPEPRRREGLREWLLRVRARAIDLACRLSSRRTGLALVYHALAPTSGDANLEVLPPHALDVFARQLRALRRRYRIVRASELPDAVRSRRRGARLPVALTFDDDLPSHAQFAAPVLQELGLPGTFFLSGASADGRHHFWWQDLQRAVDRQLLTPADVPGVDRRDVTAALERRPDALRRLAGTIERLDNARGSMVRRRLRELGGDHSVFRLEPTDIRAIAGRGLEIGFHTLEHPLLTQLDDDELQGALIDGRDRLERQSGQTIRLFAYPHGKVDGRVVAAAKRAGYKVAYCGGGRAVQGDTGALSVPRWEPPQTAGADFELAVARAIRG
jgi:peptidoglycan/xylan/chitin deacetylase (PgdA/CDA1 family)